MGHLIRESGGSVTAGGASCIMSTLQSHLEREFPAGRHWAVEAAARLGDTFPPDTPVRAVSQGWMQLGSGALIDTLFVLTEDRLGFGQTAVLTSDPPWLPLRTIRAIDLIEGLPHPLNPVEVQLANGLAMFVGWPDDFLDPVLDRLRSLVEVGPHEPQPDAVPAPTPAPAVSPHEMTGPTTGAAANPLMAPLFAAAATADAAPRSAPVVPEVDLSVSPNRPPLVAVPPSPAPDPPAPEPVDNGHAEAAADRFFAEMEPSQADVAAALAPPSGPESPSPPPDHGSRAPWDDPAMVWPEPIEHVVFLGGHPRHPRRRKRTTLVLGRQGVVALSEGLTRWSVHLPWTEVIRIDIQGADEIKFTHNQRIDLNSAAIVVEVADSTAYVFECRGRRPASLRASLAPVVNMVAGQRRPGPGFVAL